MPLFRFHRGSLTDSLQTTVIVKNLSDIYKLIVKSDLINIINGDCKARIDIEPYPSEGKNFDRRIGWYTHIVMANLIEEDIMLIVGFLSESLNE